MRAVKGRYENGAISLLEEVELPERIEVTVLIPDELDARVPEALRFAGILSDLTPEEEAAFDEALRRPIRFSRGIEP